MSSSPLVSVIMPVYNCEGYLVEALDSITKQTYKNLEIVVVDDHSSDKSWQIVRDFAKRDKRIKAFRNEQNLRLTKTLNFAIRQSSGKYLARMDGDDIRIRSSIEKQVNFLESHPKVVVVGGAAEFCDINMNRMNDRFYPTNDKEIRNKIFRYSPFCHASIVARSSAMTNDPYKVDWAEDYDLYFRLGLKGQMANINEVLYRVRTYKESISQSKQRLMEKETLRVRLKAVRDLGYKMSAFDKVYFAIQLSTMYLMPVGFRFWLFNKIRSRIQ